MIIIYNLSPLIVLVGDSFWGSNLQNYGTQSTQLTAANIVIIKKINYRLVFFIPYTP